LLENFVERHRRNNPGTRIELLDSTQEAWGRFLCGVN
jgi:hypothetical protein